LWVYNLEVKEWLSQPLGDQGPSGRHFHTCVLYDRSLWVFGGLSNGIHHDLYKYNLDTSRWALVATNGSVPSPRYGHTAVVYGDSMFVYGGFDQMGFACNDLYELNLTTLHWENTVTTGAVPKEAYHHTAVVFQGSMYTFGGYRRT
jgi:N-acetylneuraminic acid mutarotase